MRFPDAARALLACLGLAAGVAAASPEQVRGEVARRLAERLPGVGANDYALGAAAIDEGLRAEIASQSGAASAVTEAGRKLWERKFPNGRSLSGCFPNGGRRVAAAYPQYDARLKRVVTLEMAINQCLKSHKQPIFEPSDPQTMGAVLAYLRSLSAGMKVAVRVPQAAEAHFELGRRLYVARQGQRNFACASCHVQHAGKRHADRVVPPAIGHGATWPLIREGQAQTLQAMVRECLERMGAAPFAAGSDELNDLEYYLTYLSNGLPLKPNAWRPVSVPR